MNKLEYMASRFLIETKEPGPLVPLQINEAQLRIYQAMQAQLKAGLPIKIIILKARQLGCTTGVAAWFYLNNIYYQGMNTLIAAHKDQPAWEIYRKYLRFQTNLPDAERPGTEYTNRRELIFSPPLNGRISVQTAGSLDLGRGETFQQAHLSEVAWWPNAAETMLSVQQAIPNVPGTCQILESTANGLGDLFHDAWEEAVEYRRLNPTSLDGYTPLFLPWTLDPEYSLKVPDGTEVELIKGLTKEQCYWRQRTITEKCQGDIGLFMQEYPLTPDEAFRASGQNVFGSEAIKHYRAGCRQGELLTLTPEGVQPALTKTNCWEVWAKPRQYGQYTLGGDVARGELSDRNSERSKTDYSSAVVLDRGFMSVVAEWHGRIDTHDFGQQMLLAAKWYNNGWTSPETNDAGLAVLNVLKQANYQHIYQRQRTDEYPSDDDIERLGWKTTVQTRKLMVDDLKAAIADRSLKIYSEGIVDEMKTFIRDKTGKEMHMPGKHDDRLFALMVALQIHLRTPLDERITLPRSTLQVDAEPVFAGKRTPSYAYIGGVDDFDPGLGDSAWELGSTE